MTGRQLRNLRKRLGWTQVRAAKECGVTVRTWSRWEAGEVSVPIVIEKFLRLTAAK